MLLINFSKVCCISLFYLITYKLSTKSKWIPVGFCKCKLQVVGPSPWPFLISSILVYWGSHIILVLKNFNDVLFNNAIIGFFLGLLILFCLLVGWWLEMLLESYQGFQNKQIRNNIRLGFKLFLVSECMLFCSTFWAYLHSALTPTIWIGCVWPPVSLTIFNPWRLPLIMTLALIGSGLSLTLSYIILLRDESTKECFIVLLYAISHGCLFIFFQVFEFYKRPVTFTDSVFGCSFYASTSLHAFHVLVGLIFLMVIAGFVYCKIYTTSRHLSFDLGIWYWHFVDVMWLVVFALCYVWCMGWFFSLKKMFLIRPYYILINNSIDYLQFTYNYPEWLILIVISVVLLIFTLYSTFIKK